MNNANVHNEELMIVQEILEDIKQCPQNYVLTKITGAIVRRVYIACKRTMFLIKNYGLYDNYLIINAEGFVIFTYPNLVLYEFENIKKSKNIINSL
jgi:hypothetical protein